MLGSSVGLSAVSFTSLRDENIPFKNNSKKSDHNKRKNKETDRYRHKVMAEMAADI